MCVTKCDVTVANDDYDGHHDYYDDDDMFELCVMQRSRFGHSNKLRDRR